MTVKSKLKPLSLAVGAAFATSLAISPMASAVENPFAMNQLSSGYKLADNHMGKEANCGANKAKTAKEGNCGGKERVKEGNCGSKVMPKGEEAKCGANKKAAEEKKKEGKCGEAKCGANKK